MFRLAWTNAALLAAVVAAWTARAEAASPLTADTIRAGLRTANPDEEAYITYVATLLGQGRLPQDLVESTFQWARGKPHPKKAEYFKFGLITRAKEIGITLPSGTPSLAGTIQGRVFLRMVLVDVPAPGVAVTIAGTNRQTVTNGKGRFAFSDVPLGTYTLRAKGVVALLLRSGSAEAMLPSRPPSDEPVRVRIALK